MRRTAKKTTATKTIEDASSGDSSKLVAAAALAHLKEMRIRTHNFVRHDGFSPKVPRDR